MRLYIPTTTLNFNNILSSETISPKAFYERRGYGYRRWETVEENCLENGILLYKEPFSFTRPDNGLDDYSMLVELEMDEDEVAKLEKCGEWGYKSAHSLTLTPGAARLIFLSKEHKQIVLSKSELSAETKLVGMYRDRLSVETYSNDIPKRDVPDFETPDIKALEDDKRLNKIKGFVYGYVIGRMLSRTEIGVKTLNARYGVRDLVASIMSSNEGIATKEQEETLGRSLLMSDDLYVCWLGRYGKNLTDEIYSDLEKSSLDSCSKRKEWLSYLLKNLPVKEKWVDLQQWIAGFVDEAEAKRVGDYSILDEEGNAEITVMHGKLTSINRDVEYVREYAMLVNDVFTSDEYNGKVSTFRMNLAEAVTDCVVADYGEKWSDSDIRTYLNAMRRYVAGEAFTQPWDNVVLSSITAVIMKGEDWEGLFRFMVSKGMCDYRYAFGLYGALNGFANLTRDFTDIFFASENKRYVWNVYKEIHRQLTGVKLDEVMPEINKPLAGDIRESKIGNNEVANIVKSAFAEEMVWLKENDINFTSQKKRELVERALNEANGDKKKLLGILIERGVSKTKCERLLKKLQGGTPNKKGTDKKGHSKALEQTLFDAIKELNNDNPDVGSFDDEHIGRIMQTIKRYFPYLDKRVYDCLENDLGYSLDPGWNKGSTPETRIKKFCQHLHDGKTKSVSSKGKDMTWKNRIYENIDINSIYQCLMDTYCK